MQPIYDENTEIVGPVAISKKETKTLLMYEAADYNIC